MFLVSQLATPWHWDGPFPGPLSWVYFLKPLPVPFWDASYELGTKGTIYSGNG